ncbi:MAG: MATE family efflux transporter [Lachnospiraceae bacterium]
MSREKTLIRNFTEGSIPELLFAFMLPFMASNAFQVLYSAVDMIVVGQYVGKAGLSAVSLGGQVLNFFTMVCTGLCTGGQILISQLIGARRKEELNKVIGTIFSFILLLAFAASVLILVFRFQILALLHTPVESFDMAVDYLSICGVGLIFSFGYNMVSAVLRGMGDSRRPFLFITIASVVNLVLDLLFTGVLGYGVAGAAAATMLGQAVSFVFAMVFLYHHREMFQFDFKWKSWSINRLYLKSIASQGVPLALSSSAIYFSMFYVNRLINQTGLIASATFGVGMKIDDVCTKISIGIRYAAAPMVAQNYAAKQIKRVKQIVYWSWIFGALFHGIFMVIYLLIGQQAFLLFTSDPDILQMAPIFIKSIIWTFIPLAILRGSNALIQGIGNAKLSMCLGILDGVVFRIGFSYFFGIVMGYGFAGFVLGYGLAPLGAAIPGVIYFFSGVWKRHASLVEEL